MPFSYVKQRWDFLERVTGWLVPSTGQKIPVQPSSYLPPQRFPLAESKQVSSGR